ncbi:MAG: hypothetical protein V4677_02475 [Bacteroidota bacterium]
MVIYAIPGLGTTEKLYENIAIKGVEMIVLKWPLPEKNDTMQSYARKFLAQINTEQHFCLMGVSFGGMLCCELSKIISPKKIFLISTSKCRAELPWFIRFFKYVPIHRIIPEKTHRKMAYQSGWFIGFGKAFIPQYLGMIDSMEKNYFKNAINIIVNWNQKAFPENYIHIHGNGDKLLMHKFVKVDHTIENGSHAMIVFQAEEIGKIVEKEINLI